MHAQMLHKVSYFLSISHTIFLLCRKCLPLSVSDIAVRKQLLQPTPKDLRLGQDSQAAPHMEAGESQHNEVTDFNLENEV